MKKYRRKIKYLIKGVQTSDGAGVNLMRIIGSPELNMLDPFLLLDEFGSDNPDDYIAGFPPHPHRGFETVTYMINGKFRHKDTVGNEGHLTDGGVQWMTAGKGVVHSEMPEQTEGLVRGFQLWLNLPKEKKMIEPAYHDIQADEIPSVSLKDGQVKVISGEYKSIVGPGRPHTGVLYLDVHLNKKRNISIPIEKSWNSFIYVYEGEIKADDIVSKGTLAVLETDGLFECESSMNDTKFILVAGDPICEPVARGGPFVMNTRGEVMQAFNDYQSGNLK
jgi:redox-sensitive bicupin YhaK (pirin superfamily)|tara:strand:- start:154 stop:984 length:831 start_codon:yes stop_codon:yes gene_type:complete